MNTNYTDTQLKQALAKMLPEKVRIWKLPEGYLTWQSDLPVEKPVLDTELLHLCWLVEETLDFPSDESVNYAINLEMVCGHSAWQTRHATWQQRVIALCKVKGVEI